MADGGGALGGLVCREQDRHILGKCQRLLPHRNGGYSLATIIGRSTLMNTAFALNRPTHYGLLSSAPQWHQTPHYRRARKLRINRRWRANLLHQSHSQNEADTRHCSQKCGQSRARPWHERCTLLDQISNVFLLAGLLNAIVRNTESCGRH